jgi:hypothetical protein
MAQTYYHRSTIFNLGHTSATHRVEHSLTQGSSATTLVSATHSDGADSQFVCFTNNNVIGSADWASGDYQCVIDCTAAGADMTYGLLTLGASPGHFGRKSNGGIDQETREQAEGVFSGTGLKTATSGTWDPSAGSSNDKFECVIAARRTPTGGHGNQTVTIEVDDPGADPGRSIWDGEVATAYDQNAFRVRTGDTVGLNADTGWAEVLNTDASLPPDKEFRIRFEIEAANSAASQAFQLRYQKNGAGGYVAVPNNATPFIEGSADGQKKIQAIPSAQYADLDATTNILAGSGDSFVAGSGNEDSLSGTVSFTAPSHTELEWCVLLRKLSEDEHIADGDFFDFRVYKSDGNPLDTYAVTPRLTVANDPGQIGGTRAESPARMFVATAEGDLYCLVEYTDISTKNRAVMMKSTDGGDSWNPVDEVNAPTDQDLEACDMDYIAADDTIHIAIQGPSGDDVFYWTFLTSGHPTTPDTWGISETVDTAASPATSQAVAIAHRDGDGTTVLFYKDNDGANDRVRYRIRNGTWGAEQTLDLEVSTSIHGVRLAKESDDTLHIFYLARDPGVSAELWHRWLNPSTDTLSSRTQVNQTAVMENGSDSHNGPTTQPRVWDDGGTIRVGIGYVDVGDDLYWNQSPISTIGFTSEVLISDADVKMSGAGSHQAVADAIVDDVNDEPWALWSDEADEDLMSDTRISGSWGADTERRVGIIDLVRAETFTHSAGNGGGRVVGILIEDNPNTTISGGTGYTRYIELALTVAEPEFILELGSEADAAIDAVLRTERILTLETGVEASSGVDVLLASEPVLAVENGLEADTASDVVLEAIFEPSLVVEQGTETDVAQDLVVAAEPVSAVEQGAETDTAADAVLVIEPVFAVEQGAETDTATDVLLVADPRFSVESGIEVDVAADPVIASERLLSLDVASASDTAQESALTTEPVITLDQGLEPDTAADVLLVPEPSLAVEVGSESDAATDPALTVEPLLGLELGQETDVAGEIVLATGVLEPEFVVDLAQESDTANDLTLAPEVVFLAETRSESDTAADSTFTIEPLFSLDLGEESDSGTEVVLETDVSEPAFIVDLAEESAAASDISLVPEAVLLVEFGSETNAGFDLIIAAQPLLQIEVAAESDIAGEVTFSTAFEFLLDGTTESDIAVDFLLAVEPVLTLDVATSGESADGVVFSVDAVFIVEPASESSLGVISVLSAEALMVMEAAFETDVAADLLLAPEPLFELFMKVTSKANRRSVLSGEYDPIQEATVEGSI